MEPEIIRGLALAAILIGFGTMAAGLAAGGNIAMVALGLMLAGLSMDLFRVARSRDRE